MLFDVVVIIIVARSMLKNTALRILSVIFLVLTAVSISSLVLGVSQAKNPVLDWTTQNKHYNDQIRFTKKNVSTHIVLTKYKLL